MREDYAAVVHMAEQLVKAAREAANLVVGTANDAEQGMPVYEWAHDTYDDLGYILEDLAQARRSEP